MPKKSPKVIQNERVDVKYEKKCYPDGAYRESSYRREMRQTLSQEGSQASTPAQPSIENGSKKQSRGNHS